jgi:hypothetical protein
LKVTSVASGLSLGSAVTLSEPPVESPRVIAAPAVSADGDSALSVVTAAFKSAGQTIVRTGVKTGASIRDAFVFFGGAFKKIL